MKSLAQLFSREETRWIAIASFVLTLLQSFFGPLDLLTSSKLTVDLNGFVYIKLLVAAMAAAASGWGVYLFSSVRQTIIRIPAILLITMLLLTLAGGLNGVTAAAIPSALINTASVVFVIVALTTLGFRAYCFAILLGIVCTAFFGLALYYCVPERGIFLEPLDRGEFLKRIGGMAHPNSIARSVTIASLIVLYLCRRRELPLVLSAALLLLFGWNAMLAKSRTAIVGGVLGASALTADKLRSQAGIMLIGAAIIAVISFVFYLFATGNEARLVDRIVGLVSKSGDTSELTSGTGRNEIWMESLKHIARRPLFGYGLNSGPVLLIDHSQATHNAILHATLAGGLIAGAMMIGLQLWTAWIALTTSNLLVRSLCIFLVISCLTEDTVLETFPGPCTLLWFACCLIPTINDLSQQ